MAMSLDNAYLRMKMTNALRALPDELVKFPIERALAYVKAIPETEADLDTIAKLDDEAQTVDRIWRAQIRAAVRTE